MNDKVIECVPNFSDGQHPEVYNALADTISGVAGVKLLGVEPGFAANRTVITFAGAPDAVVEAAFCVIKKAAELIDMSMHSGEHPCFGATDVCPLIPVSNVSMDEVIGYARKLSKRVGEELGIPVFCYEELAFLEERKSLAKCRKGGYKALKERIESDRWKPDFGASEWSEHVAKSGAVAIGARNFLVAYNINLNTDSVSVANEIACDIRETGRVVKNENGEFVRISGSLKKIRAIGWYIKEYDKAQVSVNLIDVSTTSVHVVYDETCKMAEKYGVKVTGSELIGLIPLKSMLDAGKYFLNKQNQSITNSEAELVDVAVKSLGLNDLAPFDSQKKIFEYVYQMSKCDSLQ
jgi:glutamate formiminotransferase/formiminotetrahydrofolate cyclodeaminase